MARLIAVHAAHDADATIAVTEVPPTQTDRYGIVIGSPLGGAATPASLRQAATTACWR